MTQAEYVQKLIGLRACAEGLSWFRRWDNPQQAWDNFDRLDWMMWLIGRSAYGGDRVKIVRAACRFARLALPYARGPEALACIETAEAWADGRATLDQVREARRAVAAYAAYVAYAADAAYVAADAAYVAAYVAAARRETGKKCCGIIREFWPEVPVI